MNSTEKKIDDIIEGKNLTNSQLDRLIDPKMLLMDYLNNHVREVQKLDPLIQKIKNDFTDNYKTLSDGTKIKLLELLLKKETEDNTPLINLFAKALEVKKDDKSNPNDTPSGKSSEGSYSQADTAKAKELLPKVDKILQMLENGEFNSSEFVSKEK